MIISVPSNARSLVHLDSEHLSYRSTQQIFLKQSLKSFCQITVVRFSSFFLTIDMHKPAKFGGFFSIDEAIYTKDWAVPSVYVY